jgi:hypothetical protein
MLKQHFQRNRLGVQRRLPSLRTTRDETITFARPRGTRGVSEAKEETIDEVENRPDLAESSDITPETCRRSTRQLHSIDFAEHTRDAAKTGRIRGLAIIIK